MCVCERERRVVESPRETGNKMQTHKEMLTAERALHVNAKTSVLERDCVVRHKLLRPLVSSHHNPSQYGSRRG